MEPIERALFLFVKSATCGCRCRHCDFVASHVMEPSWDETRVLLQPFVDVRSQPGAGYNTMAVLLADSPLNARDLAAGMRYLKQYDIEGWYSLPVNGFRRRSADAWQSLLESLREIGTQYLEFTLYGQADTHDWFARRPGDYAAIHDLAGLWHRLGGQSLWSLVVHKRNLGEIDGVRQAIRDRFGAPCPVRLWDYLGSGVEIDNLRPDESDLACLSETCRAELSSVRPERDWCAELCESTEPVYPPEPRVLHVVLYGDGRVTLPYTPAARGHAGLLLSENAPIPVPALLERWRANYDIWRARYPTIGELCRRHSDPMGTRLYSRKSVLTLWRERHDRERMVDGATLC